MIILGIDTSNAYTSVSISNNNDIIWAEKDFEQNKQAEKLLQIIENALLNTKLQYNDLDYLSVCSGPGSFTGIRIGLAASNGILIGCPNLKSVNVTNFETLNLRIREQSIDFNFAVCCVHAHRGEIYAEIYDRFGVFKKYDTYTYEKLEELIFSLNGKVAVAGSGIEKIFTAESFVPNESIKILPRFPYPDARFVCKVAHRKISRGYNQKELIPLYIRKPDAKIPVKLINYSKST